ncbi:hypothetical protein BE221DRAFT_199669 [Ostreococcus tauri]|uniref:CBS domain-containing protein n=1 Tax=Ostreococcus tauri TaxID=70448 RepID=A0A1Y5ICK8_OSTTA|nr:hypothetical protein BE221DRAFT_199669 [Ostreococcus tauri]
MRRVKDFMTPASRCVTASTDSALESVVHSMVYDSSVGCVVVLDPNGDGTPRGIITKSDALEWFLQRIPLETTCALVMNANVTCASPMMTAEEVGALLTRKRVHHLAVTDDDGAFAGVASSWDVARECGRRWTLPFWDEYLERVASRRRAGSSNAHTDAAASA